ncbi:MAG: hypothetical protein KBA26_13655 [Candidatus Delongbacteria bacterium]|nr:hypothetical protein [Candidatus Delongbacteria bacterium]
MKKTIMSLILLTSLILFGCTAEKDFTMKFDKTYNLDYALTEFAAPSLQINAGNNENFNKYKDDIKSVELQKVTYTITNFVGSATQTLDTAVVIVDSINTLSRIGHITLANVAAVEQVLPYDQTIADQLAAKMLNSPHTAEVRFHGRVNQAPVKFTIKFTFEFKVTYKKKIL